MWSRTVSPASTEQGLPGASVTVAGNIETDHGTPPKDVDTAVPQKHPLKEEKWIRPGYPDRPREASLGGRDRSSETDGEQARPRLPVMTLLLLLVPVRCFFCLSLPPPWQHSIDLRCGRRFAARGLRFLLRGLQSALEAQ
ncbi:hypothetical protein TcCL_NonESM12399 [Trypanosoma cruzi]|nr:hypothetical protein TcCL_NonESM12399 [Trypanosoma cruzi]